MNNLDQIKERYLKEPFNMRLGHLASDLVRISTFSDRNAIKDIVEESKFFIEWTAPEAPFHTQELLSEIQSKLALWQCRLAYQKDIGELKNIARTWSKLLIEMSGLLVA
jgi:hypothetical protein